MRAGDLLMVHASLRKIGLGRADVGEGGAELLLDALEAAVGPDGTLLMVLGTDYPMDWVYEHPPEARAALLAGSPPFDHRNAPVLPEVGWLAEAFRRRPGHAGQRQSERPLRRARARWPRRCSPISPGTIITGRARRSRSCAAGAAGSCAWAPIPRR